MEVSIDFNDLFVLDLANNHQGSIPHGLNIIREMGKVVKKHDVKTGIKFQFRQLDSFIHPKHQKESDNKHVPRFLSTRLDRPDFQVLLDEVRKQDMLAICTPFDEESVDIIKDMQFDILKVASCSAADWPLLEKIADADMPVIFSTGGLSLNQIDDVVSFFDHRGVDFAIMHCISIYPTPPELCQLNQVDTLISRYPNKVIGWSTHETPTATTPVKIAVAKGAKMFERHVGITTDKIKLNAYSSTPAQVDKWISAYKEAVAYCGEVERPGVTDEEAKAIHGLRRGVYAKRAIKAGEVISRDQVYFAMPCNDGQLSSGEWSDTIIATESVNADSEVLSSKIILPHKTNSQILKTAVHEVKAMLNEAKIALNSEFEVEYSHHYGVESFREVGAVIINCINREYCKKLIVQLPGQSHPSHFHKRKEETFQVLHGELHVDVEGIQKTLQPGETCLVQPGVWHSFKTDTGCVFEEVSTTHYNDDSFYKDKAINKKTRDERKTKVDHWGRFELSNLCDEESLSVTQGL